VDSEQRGVTANVATLRRMWAAYAENRIDDMLQWVHVGVEWEPWFRPGFSVYAGHQGVRRMLADILTSIGPHKLLLDEIVEVDADHFVVTSQIVRRDEPLTEMRFEMQVEMRDGLVHRISTAPR
jgi:hypothetical protein